MCFIWKYMNSQIEAKSIVFPALVFYKTQTDLHLQCVNNNLQLSDRTLDIEHNTTSATVCCITVGPVTAEANSLLFVFLVELYCQSDHESRVGPPKPSSNNNRKQNDTPHALPVLNDTVCVVNLNRGEWLPPPPPIIRLIAVNGVLAVLRVVV